MFMDVWDGGHPCILVDAPVPLSISLYIELSRRSMGLLVRRKERAMEDRRNIRPETAKDLPGRPESLWTGTTPGTGFPSLDRDLRLDAVVVGGGIAGLTTAMLLQEAGLNTAVVESRRIVMGVTAKTTAKITALQGTVYRSLVSTFGREGARIYADANVKALEQMADLIEREGISCGFSRDLACTYTRDDKEVSRIEEEVKAAEGAGLPVFFTRETALPFGVSGAVCLKDQAKFHPREYLLALAMKFTGAGGLIFEHTRAQAVRKAGASVEVATDKGSLRAGAAVIATHYPVHDPAFFFSRLYPQRSYLLAARLEMPCPEGMYISIDEPFHTIRGQAVGDDHFLLIGGIHHKPGHVKNTAALYRDVERYAREHFAIGSIDYHWSTQDNWTPDNVPYIGPISPHQKNIYVATGFAGWGMAHSMVAALIIKDAVLGGDNDWSPLYNPSRFKPGGVFTFARENLHVAREIVTERFFTRPEPLDAESLRPGEGGLFARGEGQMAAARDSEGELHAVSPRCTHMGCLVSWNNAEESWDCPCHGSRFTGNGRVIHAPAFVDLKGEPPQGKEGR
jgi:glycine/D-amino acid oxidase-like deaminating enzyme/nitrite reductase/ring-hydroxylating ferredoxin subunit